MPRWIVDIATESRNAPHGGRDVTVEVESIAMLKALLQFEMSEDELLHTLFAHIGRPLSENE